MHVAETKCLDNRGIIWGCNLNQSTFLTESQKTLEAHGCKPCVTNLSIVSHTFSILMLNITYYMYLRLLLHVYVSEYQVNTSVV